MRSIRNWWDSLPTLCQTPMRSMSTSEYSVISMAWIQPSSMLLVITHQPWRTSMSICLSHRTTRWVHSALRKSVVTRICSTRMSCQSSKWTIRWVSLVRVVNSNLRGSHLWIQWCHSKEVWAWDSQVQTKGCRIQEDLECHNSKVVSSLTKVVWEVWVTWVVDSHNSHRIIWAVVAFHSNYLKATHWKRLQLQIPTIISSLGQMILQWILPVATNLSSLVRMWQTQMSWILITLSSILVRWVIQGLGSLKICPKTCLWTQWIWYLYQIYNSNSIKRWVVNREVNHKVKVTIRKEWILTKE